MTRPSKNDPTESGILVYPKLPMPENRPSEPRIKRPGKSSRGQLATFAAGGLAAGALVGFLLRPAVMPDARIAKLELAATEATKVASVQKERADGLDAEVKKATAANAALDTELVSAKAAQQKLSDKAVDEAKRIKAADDAAQAKLAAALEKGTGSVSTDGTEIRLQLVDKVLFKVGDDQLTDRGKAVLAKVAVALKELPDKQIWVQGHTDDTPIVIAPPAKRPAKGAPPPGPRFASNWELSAARALTVVHYLQDVAKIDPAKLAALAFGPYRPVSRSNKTVNRRIEIVLYPHRAVIERK